MNTANQNHETTEVSWRDRAIERSLRDARAKAAVRSDRFIQAAIEILDETGRIDFTIQELIEKAKTSLRTFYQHFGGKDELMLALFEEILTQNVSRWRAEVEGEKNQLAGLRLLVEKTFGRTGTDIGLGINRALTLYHLQLAETRSTEYARVLLPLRELIRELITGGVAEGLIRDDIDAEKLAVHHHSNPGRRGANACSGSGVVRQSPGQP